MWEQLSERYITINLLYLRNRQLKAMKFLCFTRVKIALGPISTHKLEDFMSIVFYLPQFILQFIHSSFVVQILIFTKTLYDTEKSIDIIGEKIIFRNKWKIKNVIENREKFYYQLKKLCSSVSNDFIIMLPNYFLIYFMFFFFFFW